MLADHPVKGLVLGVVTGAQHLNYYRDKVEAKEIPPRCTPYKLNESTHIKKKKDM